MSDRSSPRARTRLSLSLVLALTLGGVLAAGPAVAAPAGARGERPAQARTTAQPDGSSTVRRDVVLTGSRGTRQTFQATVTTSAPRLAAGLPGATPYQPANRFDQFTGIYYYSKDQPIWTYTTDACLSLNLVEWKECMAFRIYYVRNHVTGKGIVVWGANYTFAGLRGARHCHSPGSGTAFARYENLACGEHRYDPDKTQMKTWDQFQMTYNPGPQEVYAFHVRQYANGNLKGPYNGLGL